MDCRARLSSRYPLVRPVRKERSHTYRLTSNNLGSQGPNTRYAPEVCGDGGYANVLAANARLLLCSTPKAKKGYIDSERLIIAIVIEPPTDTRPPRGLITKAAIKPAIRAIILDTHHDEDSGDRVALTGPPRNSFGEALESLLLVAATKLSGQIGDVSGCGIEDEDVQNGAEGKER